MTKYVVVKNTSMHHFKIGCVIWKHADKEKNHYTDGKDHWWLTKKERKIIIPVISSLINAIIRSIA